MKSVFDAVANKFSKAAKKKGITLKSLLADLKRIRRDRNLTKRETL